MPITVVCHKCGALATVPDWAAGRQGKCANCGDAVDIPGGATRRCRVCHADVSNAERTKDAAGNYYCAACGKAKQNGGGSGEPLAKAPTAPESASSSELATCVMCKADFPGTSLSNFDGDLVCSACARQAELGTKSYRTNKTRRGGARVIYRCPQCKGGLESPLGDAGKEDYCPRCAAPFEVPGRYEAWKAARSSASPATSAQPNRKIPASEMRWWAIGAATGAAVLLLLLVVLIPWVRARWLPTSAKTSAGAASAAKRPAAIAVTAKATDTGKAAEPTGAAPPRVAKDKSTKPSQAKKAAAPKAQAAKLAAAKSVRPKFAASPK